MKYFSLKSLLQNWLGFVNFRTMIRLHMNGYGWRRNRTFFLFEGREYTYREAYKESQRYANLFLAERGKLVESGKLAPADRLTVGIYMDNVPEFIFAALGAGLSNSVLFSVNTGFRGETLAKVMEKAAISHLLINASTISEVERVRNDIPFLTPGNILYSGPENDMAGKGYRTLDHALTEADKTDASRYQVPIDNFSPAMVIYTSGTTGLPKGVPCTHVKLFGAGLVVKRDTGLRGDDRGYICMPLFHSNAWFVGILPLLVSGGSFVLKRKFSARAFEEDILAHGVTYLNYVGQPLHYIIEAMEKKYGGGDGVEKALANHPKNKFRIAYGNGASGIDRTKLMRYLGMEHIYEIYGSTEAVVTTANRPGDPIDSVGEAVHVLILDEQGRECQPGVVDALGKLTNYDQSVGEICRRVGEDNVRFEGYFGNNDATAQKFRGGIYHSGDLGHVKIVKGKRYLYFNGRTDDWIRKDGENFSAENVVHYAREMPGIDIAIAYGAPCDVADEKVMAAVQPRKGVPFNPDAVYAWLVQQQKEGGMDPKWMPDFIRIEDEFPMTDTLKIVVKPYKRAHYNLERDPSMKIWFRLKEDTTYRPLTPADYAAMKAKFAANGRESMLN